MPGVQGGSGVRCQPQLYRAFQWLTQHGRPRYALAGKQPENRRIRNALHPKAEVLPVDHDTLRNGLGIGQYPPVAPLPAIPRLSCLVRDATLREYLGEWTRCRNYERESAGTQDPMGPLTCHKVDIVLSQHPKCPSYASEKEKHVEPYALYGWWSMCNGHLLGV
jgi:hypothetical protein